MKVQPYSTSKPRVKRWSVFPLLLSLSIMAGIGLLFNLLNHTDKENLLSHADKKTFLSHAHKEALLRHSNKETEVLEAVPTQKDTVELDPAIFTEHCPFARGRWCGSYWQQDLVPTVPVAEGNKECADSSCNGVGWCNHDTGTCTCPAGYTGDDCTVPKKRECFMMGPDGYDKNMTAGVWLHTRCAGLCDDDLGQCYCPSNTKYGWKPGHKAASRQRARPLNAVPNTTRDGRRVPWASNAFTYNEILGPQGWCNADIPMRNLDCLLDGRSGPLCNVTHEQVCMNQCSGHGECQQGFCMCDPGWYGHDCIKRRKGLPTPTDDPFRAKPWLRELFADIPAAKAPSERPFRKRPFIYVYDLPPELNSHLMQYRTDKNLCTNRLFEVNNASRFEMYTYSLETHFHEMMLKTEHRTLDPEEADYFYVPVYLSCLADIVGKADKPIFPDDVPGIGMWEWRVFHMSMMMREAWKWLSTALPYWNRKQGADHIWLMTHDEGACYAPKEIWNSVLLTHWGRMDMPHGSNSSYPPDNYSREREHPSLPNGWLASTSHAHPCHDPHKHLVVPVFKTPEHYKLSIYLGGYQPARDIFLFFRGDIGLHRRGCTYSRCTRQRLWKLIQSQKEQWKREHNVSVVYGTGREAPGDYSQLLTRSKFCLVLTGDGWSARYEDSTTHGCIPVIVMDNTLGPFESQIDYSKFSIRIGEHHLGTIMDTLLSITPERVAEMQANLANAWMRFKWSSHPLTIKEVHRIMKGAPLKNDGMKWAATGDNDAFSTVMQWLYYRLQNRYKMAV